MTAMPMFPLGSPLYPGAALALHVFEPRYRELVRDCLAADVPEFGVVMIERGSEVGGGDQRSTWGTVARMVQVGALPDGRYSVVAVGGRRLKVSTWLPDDPYPHADVEDWPEDGGDAADEERLIAAVSARVRRALALSVELGDLTEVPEMSVSADPVSASYRLGALAPIGPADRHKLLGAPGPRARLEMLEGVLDDVEALLRFRLGGAAP